MNKVTLAGAMQLERGFPTRAASGNLCRWLLSGRRPRRTKRCEQVSTAWSAVGRADRISALRRRLHRYGLVLLATLALASAESEERRPETASRLLQAEDIRGWSDAKLRAAINEMYARHGADFKDKEIKKAFLRYDWYHPRPSLTYDAAEAEFSDIEKQNVKLLGEARTKPPSHSSRSEQPFGFRSVSGSYVIELADNSIVLSRDRNVIAKMEAYGFLLQAFWSPDGKYVAVNNPREGRESDALLVFALPSGKVLIRPIDATSNKWMAAAAQAIEKHFPETGWTNMHGKAFSSMAATGWKDGRLQFVEEENEVFDELKGRYRFEASADPATWSITKFTVSKH